MEKIKNFCRFPLWIISIILYIFQIKQVNDYFKELYGKDAWSSEIADQYIDSAAIFLKKYLRHLVLFSAFFVAVIFLYYRVVPTGSQGYQKKVDVHHPDDDSSATVTPDHRKGETPANSETTPQILPFIDPPHIARAPSLIPTMPPPDLELPSDARLATLRLAAENWRHRTGPDFQDFLQSENAITQYDKNRFTSDDSVDFDILTSAENLIKWREKGLNASTKEELPIYIKIFHSNTVEDRLSIDLKKELTENGFKIVDDVLKAALFIEFTEGNETIPFLNQAKNQWQATTSYVLKFTWLGGAQMIPDTEQSITKSGADGDEAYNSSFKAASKTASEKLLLLTNHHY